MRGTPGLSVAVSILLLGGCSSTEPLKQFDLTISVSGTGSGGVSTSPTPTSGAGQCANLGVTTKICTASYIERQVVTVTANPAAGSTFEGWVGACTGTSPTCTTAMDAAKSVDANFAIIAHTLSVGTTGNGRGTITSSPGTINCIGNAGVTTGTCSGKFNNGTQVTLTASSATGHSFAGWSNCPDSSGNICHITLTSAEAVNASFTVPVFALAVSGAGAGTGSVVSSPGGISCTITNGSGSGVCRDNFTLATSITLTATPAPGYTLASWTGCDSASGNTCRVNIGFDRFVTATFQAATFKLGIMVAGLGGTVVLSPGAVTCQSGSTCFPTFAPGTVVTIAAMPSPGNYVYNWVNCDSISGNTCTVTMNSDRSAAVTFQDMAATFPLVVSATGNGNGTVTSATTGINCTATAGVTSGSCNHIFPVSSTVRLTASPASGHMLSGWTGCDIITGFTCEFSMTGSRTVTVKFTM